MSSSVDQSAIGLRERKKARTRAALRDHGLRLFREQGYAATTIEQIAEAAEVSPSTFFRYFPTKEDLVLVDDTDPLLLAALAEQPIEKNPIAAVRVAIETVMAKLSDEDRQREQERHELMVAVPELRAAAMDEFKRNVDMLTVVVAARLGRPTDDFEVRVFAGAVIGAALSVFESPTADYRSTLKALEFLEAGLPLTAR
jgi:AcrR family transcriptional regulator